ncbi:hypothetical protein Dxin01_00803 [Deinococcus xinjiangensis]|uniref:Uncharacterized protein n=1 Tax=Deinococcus xinjiangensis TaxID=457454 RepID=A0ABP9V734_9DEIO
MTGSVLAHGYLDEDVMARLRHVNLRLSELYGLRLSAEEFMTLCRKITQRRVPYSVLRRDHQDRQIMCLKLKGQVVLLVYSPIRQLIHTALDPVRGREPKRRGHSRPRPVSRRHAYAQRRAGGLFSHPECALASVQPSRPLAAQGKRRKNI